MIAAFLFSIYDLSMACISKLYASIANYVAVAKRRHSHWDFFHRQSPNWRNGRRDKKSKDMRRRWCTT